MKERIMNYLNKYKLLSVDEFGIQSGKGTESATAHLTKHILEALDKGNFTTGIFLVLTKAFDTADHNILLNKLDELGIRGIVK